MGTTEIEEFTKDPLTFIKTYPVDLQWGTMAYLVDTDNLARNATVQESGELTKIGQYLIDCHSMIKMDIRTVTSRDYSGYFSSTQWKALIPCVKHLITEDIEKKLRMVNKIQSTPNAAITGYYFPYKNGTINDPNTDCGWVDVPKTSPVYKWVFTGSMQGCEIVVVDSPLKANHYRFYHYQNASSNKKYRHQNWNGPTPIRYWLNFGEYGKDGIEKDGLDARLHAYAWNFFHFTEDTWWHYCQPLTYYAGQTTQYMRCMLPTDGRTAFRRNLSTYGYKGHIDAETI